MSWIDVGVRAEEISASDFWQTWWLMSHRFTCTCCGKEYDEIPSFVADFPLPYWDVPEDKRESDVVLTSDSCVIAKQFFFIRGCLDVPIIGTREILSWGGWVSLKDENFLIWQRNYNTSMRSHIGPFFGWLCTSISVYPETNLLKTMVHLRDNGIRPSIKLEPTEHPLAIDQRNGISLQRAMSLIHQMEKLNAGKEIK